MDDLKDLNNRIHMQLAKTLLDKIRDGEVTAAELNVARQYLKDNNVTALPIENSPMKNLIDNLPFTGDEEVPRFRN